MRHLRRTASYEIHETRDKAIYFKGYNFDPAPAKIGHVHRVFINDVSVIPEGDDGAGLITVPGRCVHSYTDALWNAWLQWQENAKFLVQQHKQLMAGHAPEELLALNLFDKF